MEPANRSTFPALSPETVLTLVEKAWGVPCSNLCRPCNSYINQVYELAAKDGSGLVVKFYRPGRWTKAALADEHDFLAELQEEEIPVVAPLALPGGGTLASQGELHFALFPKKGGRSYDEYNEEQWLELGRLLGRVHAVGARRPATARLTMAPELSTREQLDFLLKGDFIPAEQLSAFQAVSTELLAEITPLFAQAKRQRIHGDCHFSNIIYRPNESFYIIDFDDMAMGPPVQDLWMLLPGYLNQSLLEIDLFLEGYETFSHFDQRGLRLIEPLRAMRYIHYTAWCAHQVAEDGLSRVAPDFASPAYWNREIRDLGEQLERIRTMPGEMGNF